MWLHCTRKKALLASAAPLKLGPRSISVQCPEQEGDGKEVSLVREFLMLAVPDCWSGHSSLCAALRPPL